MRNKRKLNEQIVPLNAMRIVGRCAVSNKDSISEI